MLTSMPPKAGPAMPPVPTTLICRPSAFPRSSLGNADRSMAMDVPWVMAAPTPWSTLARMRVRTLGERPASTPQITKMVNPAI